MTKCITFAVNKSYLKVEITRQTAEVRRVAKPLPPLFENSAKCLSLH